MKALWDALHGWKTIALMALGVILTGLHGVGYIPDNIWNALIVPYLGTTIASAHHERNVPG